VRVSESADGVHVIVPAKADAAQACGPTVRWPGKKTKASLSVDLRGVRGKAWFHFRALDAGGVLLKRDDGRGEIVFAGPLEGDGAQVFSPVLDFPEGTASVRPCLVMDGASGEVVVKAVAVD
jgi:hypothetical protein